MDDISDIGVPHTILNRVDTTCGIEMLVMASELLSGDLLSLVKSNPGHKELPRLVGEVFSILRSLVREKIVHEDLHLGNVLIRSDETGYLTSVIHDFGESTRDRSPYEHLRDISKFIHSLETMDGILFEDKLESCKLLVDNVGLYPTEYEILDLLVALEKK